MFLLDDLVHTVQILGESLLKLGQLRIADLTDKSVLLGQVHTFLLVVSEVTRGCLLKTDHVLCDYFIAVSKIGHLKIFGVVRQVRFGGREASSSHFECFE